MQKLNSNSNHCWLKIHGFNTQASKIFNSQLHNNFYCSELKPSINLIFLYNSQFQSPRLYITCSLNCLKPSNIQGGRKMHGHKTMTFQRQTSTKLLEVEYLKIYIQIITHLPIHRQTKITRTETIFMLMGEHLLTTFQLPSFWWQRIKCSCSNTHQLFHSLCCDFQRTGNFITHHG